MKSTKILYPLDDDVDNWELHKKEWKSIKEYLNSLKKGKDIMFEFDQMLENLKIYEDNYLLAIRSGLTTPSIFVK